MAATIKILMILTSQPTMGVGGAPTGVWLEELTAPDYAFIDAGAEVSRQGCHPSASPCDAGVAGMATMPRTC